MWAPFKFQINRSSSLFSRLDLVVGRHDDWRRCCCRRIWRYLLNSGGDPTTASTGDRPTVLCSRWWTTRGSVPRRSSRTEELAVADSATERQSCLWVQPLRRVTHACFWRSGPKDSCPSSMLGSSPAADFGLHRSIPYSEVVSTNCWRFFHAVDGKPTQFFSFLFFLVFTTFSSSFRRICNLITFSRDKEKGPDKMFRELNVQSF